MFRKLDIGSAKVEREVCQRVPHHLLDVADIGQLFSAGHYYKLAEQALQVSHVDNIMAIPNLLISFQAVIKKGHVPMVVGGTGLYIRTLMEGLTGAPPSTLESRTVIAKLVDEEDGGIWEVR